MVIELTFHLFDVDVFYDLTLLTSTYLISFDGMYPGNFNPRRLRQSQNFKGDV